MPREFPRTRRVGEQLQRELAGLIREELKDPRLGMVSVSAVQVSRDLSHAKVYISVLGTAEQAEASLGVLKHAAGYLRHKLGKQLHIRVIPELHFFYDRSLEEGARMGALINRAIAGDRRNDDSDDESS
jgi:ribosome-binding factor A